MPAELGDPRSFKQALIQSGRYSAFAPESEDALGKSDIMDELKGTWDATVAAVGKADG